MVPVSFTSKGRIAHFFSDGRNVVSDHLIRNLALTTDRASQLLALGAVYRNRVRVNSDLTIFAGDYLRVHLEPRRYQLPESIPIVHITDDFVLVDKPTGLPVPPTVDNIRENVLAAVERQLGAKLYVTHRLDTPTSGLLVLARTPEFLARFNRWLAKAKVEKWYRARVARPLPPGSIVHYQKPDRYAPKEVSTEAHPGWLRCELTVLDCQPADAGYELTVRLETGRTHQIRCQLAALGNPILGDTLYDGTGGAPERIALQACALFLPSRGLAWRLSGPSR